MKRTYLYEEHAKLGAKFTEFGGWEMPVQYSSIIDEHNAVRTGAGVFDTSHMGTFIMFGKDSGDFLNKVTVCDMKNLADKKARYSMILNEESGIKDDIIVYRFGNEYMLVANAGNLDKDWDWLNKYKLPDMQLQNRSLDICLLALQGPKSVEIMQKLAETDVAGMGYFTCAELRLKNIKANFCRVARTGYTGEDGFEIFISKEQSKDLWNEFLKLGAKPCGLGCRDTLRLEACMPLYGHEIDENINPIDSGFGKIINWNQDFIGKGALLPFKDNPKRRLIAFECVSGIARNGNRIFAGNKEAGYVTSGTFSPTLKKAIGMALIDISANDEDLEVEIHNNRRKVKTVEKPFYKRKK